MAFFTSLTGLNAATSQLAVTSNNIANAGTTGFKRSRAEFGDIFASSPLQKASSIVGQGTIIKSISQEFSQGNIEFSQNTLDLAISGQGFFALRPDLTSVQTVFTRNGSFALNNDRYVVDGAGQYLRVFPVNEDGSVIATDLDSAIELRIPDTSGLPRASSEITLGLNLPAAAEVIPQREEYATGQAIYSFDPSNPDTYNTSTSITVFDSLGNPSIATIYYVKTQNASVDDPTNKWQTYIYVGGREIKPALISVKNDREEQVYMNKFGELTTNPQEIDPGFIPGSPHPKYILDDQPDPISSLPARVQTPVIPSSFTFGSTGDTKRAVGAVDEVGNLRADSLPSRNLFQISVDGSNFQTVSLSEPGEFNGVELAEALTREINRLFSDERFYRLDETTSQFRVAAYSRDQNDDLNEILIGAVSAAGTEAGDSRAIDLSGLENKILAGGSYSIQVGTKLFSYTAVEGDTLAEVKEALRAAIDEDTSYVASVSADGISIDSGAGLLSVVVSAKGAGIDLGDLDIQLPLSRTEIHVDNVGELLLAADAAAGSGYEQAGFTLNGLDVVPAGGAASFASVSELRASINALTASTGVRADQEGDALILRSVKEAAPGGFEEPIVIGNLEGNTANVLGLAISDPVTGTRTFGPEAINYTPELLVQFAQEQVDAANLAIDVAYDIETRSLTFKPEQSPDGLAISALQVRGPLIDGVSVDNELLGFKAAALVETVGPDIRDPEFRGAEIVPNGPTRIPSSQQRFGIKVEYLRESQRFQFSSGTTGENSRIVIRPVADDGGEVLNQEAAGIFGLDSLNTLAGEGLSSQPAVTVSGQPGRNISGAFLVSELDNKVSVSVDGISGLIEIPPNTYTGETFAAALEERINLIQDDQGRRVSGVQVAFDVASQTFRFTTGTSGNDSFISINGHPNWGLSETTATRGEVPTFFNLVQDSDELGRPIFIDRDGNETVESVAASGQNWFPVYLRKGELTFDTQGRLISPKEGARYDPFDPLNGADPITLNVDYGRNSTQFNAAFSLLSLSQDGYPSGRLDGLEVDATGVVRATYTNGQQKALGKVILANFANPNGLKQIGDANYLTTSTSGEPTLGQAGSEGFGTIQGGARERSNVDLTQELVDLITAQRNFQANAKAIETSTTLTQTIINIRS